jgi:malate dehydrogenase (oxaloacetate-decarboxylating)
MDIYEHSLIRHRETQGKIGVTSRMRLESPDDLSIACRPGMARPCGRLPKILGQPGI